ncbi:MAG: hypothetical protein CSA10_00265 [Cardiobacteriales bacterium]|nr:MAG: hypothetical protein CSA10_00265 [Cardiobacteriales bacterium]
MLNKFVKCCVFSLVVSNLVFAQEQAWISDQLRTSVNDASGSRAKFIGSLTAGSPIKILSRSNDGNYLEIVSGDIHGWISARNVMFTPSIHARFADIQAQLTALDAENNAVQIANKDGASIIEKLQSEMAELRESEAKAQSDLIEIKRISENAVAIDRRNRELQTTVVELEQKNLELRHQNARLEEKSHNRELYIGGGLVVLGFILHWLAGLLRMNRRSPRFDEL